MTFKTTAQARATVRQQRSLFRIAKDEGNKAAMATAQARHNEAMTFLRGNGSSN
jgi:hypothetical protein